MNHSPALWKRERGPSRSDAVRVIQAWEGFWPSPPSEPDGRISRIRLSSRWYYLTRGLKGLRMGCLQAEQPMLGKEGVWPALMVVAPRPRPRRRLRRCGGCCAAARVSSRRVVENVVEWQCLKYSNQPRSVRFTSAMITGRLRPTVRLRLAAHRVLELLQALLPRPAMPRVEADTQEVKALRRVHPRSASCPDAASGRLPAVHSCTAARACWPLLPAAAQDHEVVRIAHHLVSLVRPSGGRADRDRCCVSSGLSTAPLRRARRSASIRSALQDVLLQKRFDQRQHAAVGDLRRTRAISRSCGIVSK